MKGAFSTLVMLAVFFASSIAFAHEGLTDARGCHTDDDGTNFHCHNDDEDVPTEDATKKNVDEEPEGADRQDAPKKAERAASPVTKKKRDERRTTSRTGLSNAELEIEIRDLQSVVREMQRQQREGEAVEALESVKQRKATAAFLITYGCLAAVSLGIAAIAESPELAVGALIMPVLPSTLTGLAAYTETTALTVGAIVFDTAVMLTVLAIGMLFAF